MAGIQTGIRAPWTGLHGMKVDLANYSDEEGQRNIRLWKDKHKKYLPGPPGCLKGKRVCVFIDSENAPPVWVDGDVLAPGKHFDAFHRVFVQYLGASSVRIHFYISERSLASWTSCGRLGSNPKEVRNDMFKLRRGKELNVHYCRPEGKGEGREEELHGVDAVMKWDIWEADLKEDEVLCAITGDGGFEEVIMDKQKDRNLQVVLITRDSVTESRKYERHIANGDIKWHCRWVEFLQSALQNPTLYDPPFHRNGGNSWGLGVWRVLSVPQQHVKCFLGPSGAIVEGIRKGCNCKVHVARRPPRLQPDPWRTQPVLLSGGVNQVEDAVEAISKELHLQQASGPGNWIQGYYLTVPGELVEHVRHNIAVLTEHLKEQTPDGCYICSLKDTPEGKITEHGVPCGLWDGWPCLPVDMMVLHVRGQPETAKQVLQAMQELLKENVHTQEPSERRSVPPGVQTAPPPLFDHPNGACPQESMRPAAQTSPPPPAPGHTHGACTQVQAAFPNKPVPWEEVKEAELTELGEPVVHQVQAFPRQPAPSGEKKMKEFLERVEPEVIRVLDVHEKIVPRILGREGRIHRDIEEACGCNIHIHEAQNGMQLVLIRGSIAQVLRGEEAIAGELHSQRYLWDSTAGRPFAYPWRPFFEGWYLLVPFRLAQPLCSDKAVFIRDLQQQLKEGDVTLRTIRCVLDETCGRFFTEHGVPCSRPCGRPFLPKQMKVFHVCGQPFAAEQACQKMHEFVKEKAHTRVDLPTLSKPVPGIEHGGLGHPKHYGATAGSRFSALASGQLGCSSSSSLSSLSSSSIKD